MDSLEVELNPFEDENDAPFGTPDYRYFTPAQDETAKEMLHRLGEVTPELPGLFVERATTGEIVLRAGTLRAAMVPSKAPVDALVLALNELLAKSQVASRYVAVAWKGNGRAFAFTTMDESLDLLNGGNLEAKDLGELMELTAW